MAKNPVDYAEEVLGVHQVWDEANTRLAAHEEAKNTFLTSLSGIRYLEEQIAVREAAIVTEQRGEHPDMKIMEFKQHVATLLASDPDAMQHATDLREEKDTKERAEQDMRHHELGLRALTARMTELAGLLEFYAAAKQAAANG